MTLNTVGKQPFAGLKGRKTNKVKVKAVSNTGAKTLQGFVHAETQSGAQLYTDEAAAYQSVNRPHEAVKHSVGEYVRTQVSFSRGMEGFWSMLKRGYQGTYHHWIVKRTNRYVNDFSGRHNQREQVTIEQMEGMAKDTVGKHLTYATSLA